jgi:hypothetical protein
MREGEDHARRAQYDNSVLISKPVTLTISRLDRSEYRHFRWHDKSSGTLTCSRFGLLVDHHGGPGPLRVHMQAQLACIRWIQVLPET